MESRYDAVADWYAEFTQDWEPVCLPYVPEDLRGKRVLDLACGTGALDRLLADRWATVTAIDISTAMLHNAAPLDQVDYLHGDATDTRWWDGKPFDGVVSNMALMDIEDLDGALTSIAAVVDSDGWILITVLHPCFPGRRDTGTLSSWPPARGYSWEGWWTTNSNGVRGRVGAHHRMLSTYLNAVIRAGLEIVEVIEPRSAVPRHLALRCRRRRQD